VFRIALPAGGDGV